MFQNLNSFVDSAKITHDYFECFSSISKLCNLVARYNAWNNILKIEMTYKLLSSRVEGRLSTQTLFQLLNYEQYTLCDKITATCCQLKRTALCTLMILVVVLPRVACFLTLTERTLLRTGTRTLCDVADFWNSCEYRK